MTHFPYFIRCVWCGVAALMWVAGPAMADTPGALGGEQQVVAVPAMAVKKGSKTGESTTEEALAAAVKAGRAVPLNSRLYESETPIDAVLPVLPGLPGFLGLRLADQSLAVFSVREWRVVGSLPLGDTSAAFMAGDVVFVYDTILRELTRHALPDLTVTARFSVPGLSKLVGFGAGSDAAGPLTLVLEKAVNQRSVVMLDRQTLKTPVRLAAFTPGNLPFRVAHAVENPLRNGLPVHLPTSPDGRLTDLVHSMVMATPALSTDFDHPNFYPNDAPMSDRVFTTGTRYLKGASHFNSDGRAISPCGLYFTAPAGPEQDARVDLFATDDGRPLLSLVGLELFHVADGTPPGSANFVHRRVVPLGEQNLIATLTRDGRKLQVTHLELAATYARTSPGSAYVTSRPYPVVTAGHTLTYQITLSDPRAVGSYDLLDKEKLPGANIDSMGLFTYRVPPRLANAQQAAVSVQIRFKSGETAVHKFPVYVPLLKEPGKK